jgi:transcriptional regulator with AAA-type ATPase domain
LNSQARSCAATLCSFRRGQCSAQGAFTGAWDAQPGLIAEAEGRPLFLDEIETLCLGAQAKLLGFLEEPTYHALGAPQATAGRTGTEGP